MKYIYHSRQNKYSDPLNWRTNSLCNRFDAKNIYPLRMRNTRMLFIRPPSIFLHSQMKQNPANYYFIPQTRREGRGRGKETKMKTLPKKSKKQFILSLSSLYTGHRCWTTVPQQHYPTRIYNALTSPRFNHFDTHFSHQSNKTPTMSDA